MEGKGDGKEGKKKEGKGWEEMEGRAREES